MLGSTNAIGATMIPVTAPIVVASPRPERFYPIESMMLARFDGARWVLFSDVIDARRTM